MGFLLLLLVMAGLGGGYFFYSQSQKRAREDKGIERGLKMVPLLIHLPPPSEDLRGGGTRCS